MTRAQEAALARLNFARQQLGQMAPEQRAALTEERLIASYGLSPTEAAQMLNQYARRG